MRKVIYTPLAVEDIQGAVTYLYINPASPQATNNLVTALDKAVEQITNFPYASPLYRTEKAMSDEIRMIPVNGYVLYYAVTEDAIQVRRFIHGRRNRSNMTM